MPSELTVCPTGGPGPSTTSASTATLTTVMHTFVGRRDRRTALRLRLPEAATDDHVRRSRVPTTSRNLPQHLYTGRTSRERGCCDAPSPPGDRPLQGSLRRDSRKADRKTLARRPCPTSNSGWGRPVARLSPPKGSSRLMAKSQAQSRPPKEDFTVFTYMHETVTTKPYYCRASLFSERGC